MHYQAHFPLSQEYEHLCTTRDECWMSLHEMSSTVPPKSQQYCSNIVSLASLPTNSRLTLFHLPKFYFLLSLLLSILPGSFPFGFYKFSPLLKLLRQHCRGQFISPKSLTTKHDSNDEAIQPEWDPCFMTHYSQRSGSQVWYTRSLNSFNRF